MSSNPNYEVRDITDVMQVRCPDGGEECGVNGQVR